METKIKQLLAEEDLVISDLTNEELEELKEEIAIEGKGEFVLDGVLHRVSQRKIREKYDAEMQAILNGEE